MDSTGESPMTATADDDAHQWRGVNKASRKKKRARNADRRPVQDLPVVGYHILLVGAPYLTQPFSSALLQESAPSSSAASKSSSNDPDLMTLAALESVRSLHRGNSGPSVRSNRTSSSTPQKQRYVHLLEHMLDFTDEHHATSIPSPHHVVLVTETTPQAYCQGSLHELTVIQETLENYRSNNSSRQQQQQPPQSVSLLVCLTPNGNSERSVQTSSHKGAIHRMILASMAIFPCTLSHPTSRTRVAHMLWQRCEHMLRQSSGLDYDAVGTDVVMDRHDVGITTTTMLSPWVATRLVNMR